MLTGLRDDIPAVLSRTDVFCLPSWREGMPRSIIESMMMGIPVVATDIRGSREIIVDEKTGFLVDVGDVDAIYGAYVKLISSPELLSLMGVAGRKRAVEMYDEKRVLSRQISIISKFILENNIRIK